MQETGREGGEINFTQFIDSFEKSQLNTVRLFYILMRSFLGMEIIRVSLIYNLKSYLFLYLLHVYVFAS